jgi:voltage-gated potassium channel
LRLSRLIAALSVPFLLVIAGTVGYHLIEGWPLFDALYMTVITLTTVGYGEVHTLSKAGREFTIGLLLLGVFTLFYAATEIIRAIVSGEVQTLLGRRSMEQRLSELKDHVIVCGFGRMGRFVCRELAASRVPFVVIERAGAPLEEFHFERALSLHGDATSDAILERAGVKRARALIAVLASDADNLYITMSARFLNDKVFIVSRSEDEHAEAKMRRAGANRVISPYILGGHRVAQAILKPAVLDFIELALRTEHIELQIEEVRVESASSLAGARLEGTPVRTDLGLIVLAIKNDQGKLTFNPPGDTLMAAGDTVIAMGSQRQLGELEKLARA